MDGDKTYMNNHKIVLVYPDYKESDVFKSALW